MHLCFHPSSSSDALDCSFLAPHPLKAYHLSSTVKVQTSPSAATRRSVRGRPVWAIYLIALSRRSAQQVRLPSWLGQMMHVRPAPVAQPFQRVLQQGVEYVEIPLPRDFSRASRLTCIHIHSAILILPPGLTWTLEALRSCPITHLSFSKITVELRLWSAVLPLIASAAPGVTSVAFIDLPLLPEREIMEFLARLPGLLEVTISAPPADIDVSGFVLILSAETPPPHLPHLRTLRTVPTIARYLLSRPRSLPSLRDITLLLPPSSANTELRQLAQTLKSVIEPLTAHPRATARCSRWP
ncbi:hypothetical protein DFH06DRAFT_218886 [Mycena polygramma]|nr:hypothetical protein DFH06DRAFT_218886 [Mycena polygramma]